jgi:hypothetical protein
MGQPRRGWDSQVLEYKKRGRAGNKNHLTGDPVENTGLFFNKVAHTTYNIQFKMFTALEHREDLFHAGTDPRNASQFLPNHTHH